VAPESTALSGSHIIKPPALPEVMTTPVVSAEQNVIIAPSLLTLTVSAINPVIEIEADITVAAAVLTILSEVNSPTVTAESSITCFVETLAVILDIKSPSIQTARNIVIEAEGNTLTFGQPGPTIYIWFSYDGSYVVMLPDRSFVANLPDRNITGELPQRSYQVKHYERGAIASLGKRSFTIKAKP